MTKGKGSHIEHLTAKSYDENLTDKDARGNEVEAFASFQSKCTLTCLEGTGIKHVPELKHYKCGKEQAEVIKGHSAFLKNP